MTNQLQGEILYGGIDDRSNEWVYTPWMPVRGDTATFGVQVHRRNGITLAWNVETRTVEDPATKTALWGTDRTTTADDIVTSAAVLVDQLVRYRFATGSTASTSDYIVIRALQPSWLVDR